MKPAPKPAGPLLQALIEETSDLPSVAAAHARARRRSQTLVRAVLGVTAGVLTLGIWFLHDSPSRKSPGEMAASGRLPAAHKSSARHGYVKVYQPGETAPAEALASDASEREKRLLKGLPGVPVVIVRNKAGQVARVQIFDR